jgi:hypothetical protein
VNAPRSAANLRPPGANVVALGAKGPGAGADGPQLPGDHQATAPRSIEAESSRRARRRRGRCPWTAGARTPSPPRCMNGRHGRLLRRRGGRGLSPLSMRSARTHGFAVPRLPASGIRAVNSSSCRMRVTFRVTGSPSGSVTPRVEIRTCLPHFGAILSAFGALPNAVRAAPIHPESLPMDPEGLRTHPE